MSARARTVALLALILAAGCFHRRHPLSEWKPREHEAATLADLIDQMAEDCAAHRPARIGLCERNGVELAWIEHRGVIYRNAWAYDVHTGAPAYVEYRSWSDVAICLPDILDRWGPRPACEPVFLDACGSIDELRTRYGRRN